jgi:hypothetical protein
MRLRIIKNDEGGWLAVDEKNVPVPSQPPLGWTSRANALMFAARQPKARVVLAGA